MFEVALVQPEIPANTGNVIRLCANTGCRLHLVGPLGFNLRNKNLKRAGLDYQQLARVERHTDWGAFRETIPSRWAYAITSRGSRLYSDLAALPGDVFVFGSETAGLPAGLLAEFGADARIRIPMMPGNRSLNLANAVAIVVYDAWRRHAFSGAARTTAS